MSWWNFLTSSDKVVETGTDLIKMGANGIDALFYTQEEKAQAGIKVMDQVLEMNRVANEESSIRSITRRAIAWVIIGNFTIFSISALIVTLMGELEITASILQLMGSLSLPMITLAVVVFYFGNHILNKK